jgi:hypothetical protein
LKPDLRLSAEGVAQVSEQTEGFSFAYLKEIFLSSKMRWIAHPQQGTMEQVMGEQVEKLREQMLSVNAAPEPESAPEMPAMPPTFRAMMRRTMHFQGGR